MSVFLTVVITVLAIYICGYLVTLAARSKLHMRKPTPSIPDELKVFAAWWIMLPFFIVGLIIRDDTPSVKDRK